jgi:internalin A
MVPPFRVIALLLLGVVSPMMARAQTDPPAPKQLSFEEVEAAYTKVTQFGCKPAAFSAPRYFALQKTAMAQPVRPQGISRGSYTSFGRNFALRFPEKTNESDFARLLPALKNLPNLNALDFGDCRFLGDNICKGLKTLPDLQILFVDGTKTTDAGLKDLCQGTRFLWLDLSRTQITDAGMSDLASQTDLLGLILDGNPKLTDAGVARLGAVRNLRTLSLANTAVSFDAIPNATNWRALRKLSLAGTTISDASLTHVAAIKSLERLDLSRTQIRGSGLAELAAIKGLQLLTLTDVPLNDRGAKALGTLKQIHELHLNNSKPAPKGKEPKDETPVVPVVVPVGDDLLPPLAGCDSLAVLDLSWTAVTGSKMNELVGLKNLHEIRLEGAPVKGVIFEGLGQLKSLRSVDLSRTQISGMGVQLLGDIPTLESLTLEGSALDDNGAKGLGRIKSLKVLNVSQTAVTAAGLSEIGTLPLLHLDVSKTKVASPVLKTVAGMKTLRMVDLRSTEGSETSAMSLRKSLPDCTVMSGPVRELTAKEALVPRFPTD